MQDRKRKPLSDDRTTSPLYVHTGPEEIVKDIFRLKIPLPRNPLKALNSYVVRGPERNLVVDTGMRRQECMEAMHAGLDALGINLQETDFFITHFHADHLGLVSELAGETSKIYLNTPDASRIAYHLTFRQDFEKFARLHAFPEKDLQKALNTHPGFKYGPRLPLHFTEVYDGKMIDLGGYNFRCIQTPGHSFGHTCLYEAAQKILISGDHILSDITPNIQSWSDNWNPLGEYLKSLEKTALLNVALVLPGHRNIFYDMRKRIEELKEHHERREEEVLSILKEGPKTAYQVASEMTWDIVCDSFAVFPFTQKWFAVGEAIAHVNHLEAVGKIRREIKKQRGRERILWSLLGPA